MGDKSHLLPYHCSLRLPLESWNTQAQVSLVGSPSPPDSSSFVLCKLA